MTRQATKKPVKKKKARGRFFRSVMAELKKVTWPTRKELTKFTMIVIVVVIIFAVIVGFMDVIFGELLRIFTK